MLFLGKTGAGKSSMILHLHGCKMKFDIKKNDIFLVKKKSLELKEIEPSHNKVCSGTKYLVNSELEAKKLAKLMKDPSLVKGPPLNLTDFPGFLDTSGPESNIANYIGIFEAFFFKTLQFDKNCSFIEL